MAIIILSTLLASIVSAHSGLQSIVVDGTSYPPFNSRIDNFLGEVRRIEWSHDIVETPFNPITNFSDPGLACQPNSKQPLLKAPVRAGAQIQFNWTPIVRMHSGPIITYLGRVPSEKTAAQDIKFFKIWEKGFDVAQDKWANQLAVDNGDSYTVQIPSDIKSGTYTVRTELIALHGNGVNLITGPLKGPQSYPYCFNVEVIQGGSVEPTTGLVTFPGAYKATDAGLTFGPYVGNGSGIEHNSKYILPGPPLYAGKYEAPTGKPPVVQETGYYTGELRQKYDALVKKMDDSGAKLATFVNSKWPHYQPDAPAFKNEYPRLIQIASKERKELLKQVDDIKNLIAKQSKVTQKFVA